MNNRQCVLSIDDYQRIAIEAATGKLAADVLKSDGAESCVMRVTGLPNQSLILKLWNRSYLSRLARKMSASMPGQRERRVLTALIQAGIQAPRPLSVFNLKAGPFNHAMFQEDLGDCVSAYDHIKHLMAEGREEEQALLLDDIVEMTVKMINAGIIDVDHSFYNIVLTPGGDLARLDLELAELGQADLHTQKYGNMIGMLLGSYTFTVQPRTDLVTKFSKSLVDALKPPEEVLAVVEKFVAEKIMIQSQETGIITDVQFSWKS